MKSKSRRSKRVHCQHCGEPVIVWAQVGGTFQKVPYRLGPKAKAVTCGVCVSNGVLGKQKLDQIWGELITDLKMLSTKLKSVRRRLKLTQEDIGKILGVDRSMVAKVERGQKVMPESWNDLLRGHIFDKYDLTPTISKSVT